MRRLLLAIVCVGPGLLSSACGAELAIWTIGYYSSPPQAMHDGRPVTVERVPPERRLVSDRYSVLAPAGDHWALIGGAGAPSNPGALFFVRNPDVRRAFEPIEVAVGGVIAMSEILTSPDSTPRAAAGATLSRCATSGCRVVHRTLQDDPWSECARYLVVYVGRTGSSWPPRLTQTTRAGRVCEIPGSPGTFVHLWFREDQTRRQPSRYLAEASRFFESLAFEGSDRGLSRPLRPQGEFGRETRSIGRGLGRARSGVR